MRVIMPGPISLQSHASDRADPGRVSGSRPTVCHTRAPAYHLR